MRLSVRRFTAPKRLEYTPHASTEAWDNHPAGPFARCIGPLEAPLLLKSPFTLFVATLCLTGCSLLGNKVRGAVGMAPVKTGTIDVVNNGFKTICKMHVADADGAYLESYSLIGTKYEYLDSGQHHRFEVMLHDKPLKVRLSSCDGTVLKEAGSVALAENATVQLVVP